MAHEPNGHAQPLLFKPPLLALSPRITCMTMCMFGLGEFKAVGKLDDDRSAGGSACRAQWLLTFRHARDDRRLARAHHAPRRHCSGGRPSTAATGRARTT